MALEVMTTKMSNVSVSSRHGLALDEEYKQARSSRDSQLTMISILPIHLNELMIQVQDSIGTVTMPADKQVLLDTMRTDLKQASEEMLQLYKEYLKVLHVAETIDKDRQMIMDQGRSLLWPQLDVTMEKIKRRLSSISSEWQIRSENTRISKLDESLSKLLSSTVGTQVLQQTDLMTLEDHMGFLAGKLNNLQNDPDTIDLEDRLATKRGQLISTETCLMIFKARLDSAKEDRKQYLKELKDRRKDELTHSKLTQDDHQQRLQATREDIERLSNTCQSNLDLINERKSQQLAALQNRRNAVVNGIQKLKGEKKRSFALSLGENWPWGFFTAKYERSREERNKAEAWNHQMKTLDVEADWITAQTTTAIKAVQDNQEAQARELQTAVRTTMELLSPSEKDIKSLLAQQTETSKTLLKIAEDTVEDAENLTIQYEGQKQNLTSSIKDLESRLAAKNSIKQSLISMYSARLSSAKDQHYNQLEMQKNALIRSGCASLKSLIFIIQRLQHLIRIQSDLRMDSIKLATPICEILDSFSDHWDEALKIRDDDESEFHNLTTVTEPPLSTIITSTSSRPEVFDPIIRILSEAGVDSGVDDALLLLETEDEEEKQELDAQIRAHKLNPLLLSTAKRNLRKESQRQAERAVPNSKAISNALYQQVWAVYRSLDPFCALWKYKAAVSPQPADKTLQIEDSKNTSSH